MAKVATLPLMVLTNTYRRFSTMIKVEAIVREEKMEDVKAALAEINVHGITVFQVMGCGA